MEHKVTNIKNIKKIRNKKIYNKTKDNNNFYKYVCFPEYIEPADE